VKRRKESATWRAIARRRWRQSDGVGVDRLAVAVDDVVAANLDLYGRGVLVEDRLATLDGIVDPACIDDERRASHESGGRAG
jgi:hypothetical protein